MILRLASSLYGSAAARRRRWYARESGRQRHLSRPVVSIGNLRTGGSGKTPTVEHVARLLAAGGHRPAILSRGYRRRAPAAGVTVVSDGTTILAGLDAAGDEPLMLARALPGVPILVGADRHRSGCFAEQQLGATVHLLDDGFQHLQLARDVDLLLVSEDDLSEPVLPAGHLREPLASASCADALLVTAPDRQAAEQVGGALGVAESFLVTRTIGAPRLLSSGASISPSAGDRVLAVCAVARPERFFSDLRSAGWTLADTLTFRDHHPFDHRDIERIAGRMAAAGATCVLTTEKDAVRLAACDPGSLPLAVVPLSVAVEPADRFSRWLLARLERRESTS